MESPAEIRALLSHDGLVITASARAARALRGRYADELEREGRRVWAAPQILDYDSWLQGLWRQLLLAGQEDRLLLSPLQEQSLWLRIVAPAVRQRSLISSEGVAALAQQAYALLADYGAVDRLAGQPWGAPDSEVELFRQWARSFRAECTRRGWIARGDLPAVLASALGEGQLTLPVALGWLGFDRITAAQQSLIEAGERAGSVIRYLRGATPDAQSSLYTAATPADELTACAHWCREQLEREPRLRIGVIVPDLRNTRAEIERTFLRVLAPEALSILAAPAPSLPFEFSLGAPLAHMPLPRSALLMLKWLLRPLPQAEISWLLLSGFFSATSTSADDLAMAQWDAALRDSKLASTEIRLEQLIRHSASVRVALIVRLRQVFDRFRKETAPATLRHWCSLAEELLDLSGWTGARSTDSVQFQTWTAWQRLLEQAASLDLTTGRVDFPSFLRILEQAAAESIFAPESEEAPVQISGVYESSGQQFDALWFLNADDTQWPPRGRPHPLLPIGLQRELNMPHATPEIDWQLAKEVTERIHASAPTCVFSYARQNETAEVRCSPLLQDLPPAFIDGPTHLSGIYGPVLDTFSDDALLPWPIERPAGGQDVLARQAACPFQAFASKRLGARELSSAERGLSPAQRGNLLHDALESLWSNELPGHPPLRSGDDLIAAAMNGTLQPLIAEHVRVAMREISAFGVEAWQQAYLRAEESRLVALVTEWLALERGRMPFTVEACEERLDVTVGKLKLRVRADRVDQVAGGRLLLDYKTGLVTPNKWEGERPQEPQLPLYAAYGGIDDLAGALLAQVRSGDTCFKGRVRDAELNLFPILKPGSPLLKEPYSDELRDAWRDTLETLAESFTRGEAQVDPKEYPKTCQYCAFPSLCRVAETAAALRLEEAENDETTEGQGDA
ncbi:MAG: PD-(D/E)XK nuclease family protein [Acidobacteriaceae bacterium]